MKHPLKIAIGSDHGGFELKQQLIPYLTSLGHAVTDVGTNSKDAVDYPRFAYAVASSVSSGRADVGIVIDGAGIGSAMTANKVPGVLAAACYNEALARNSREHNNANVLTLGSGQIDLAAAKQIAYIFLTTECTADRHLARVKLIKEVEGRSMSGNDLSPEDVQRVAERVKQLLGGKSGSSAAIARPLSAEQVAKMIDHTLLKAEATPADVEKLCAEARKHGFWSVCVNSAYVKQAKALLRDSRTKVCAVVGFPLGAMEPQIKSLETRKALRDGANEIDMVINIGALKARDDATVLRDIRGVVENCKDSRAICKVILETSLLNDEEKTRACQLSMKAGADFVKTSTGFSTGGATAEDIALMARTVASRKLGVKASGGVRTYADIVKMVNAGATRVGCSNSVKIMEEISTGVAQSGGKGY
ncbi:MAG: deoxyribose-phosphate aldolase [Verrucomicrobia bacterium]|nr:deoxyribose-phosphate aldolase [Verrucomicrobiota bacterium]